MSAVVMPSVPPIRASERAASDRNFAKQLWQWRWNVLIGILILSIGTYLYLLNQWAAGGFNLENIKQDRLALERELGELNRASSLPASLYALERLPVVQEMNINASKTFVVRPDTKEQTAQLLVP